jgi:hypothetical protein
MGFPDGNYLRGADLEVGPDPVVFCRKAYAAFLACRIIETAWSASRKESATTSFQRGRAILAAVKHVGNAIPFPAPLEGKRDLLHLAESLFSRAVNMSVGCFNEAAKRYHAESSRVRRTLAVQD